ncbi:MAG: hypothetical protein AAGJ31_10620, partial [Verrucomicrobiota bacterium]
GGDNLDLALAHWVEPQLGARDALSPGQWSHLVARCRAVKEEALAGTDVPAGDKPAEGMFRIAVPSRGAGLMSGTLSVDVDRKEVEAFLLDGFYPLCQVDEEVNRSEEALREWGLPYATDSGITRYLAEFLRGQPRADAVLFNGGSLESEVVRERMTELLQDWQGGSTVVVLDHPERDLAVARGAARYGRLAKEKAHRIRAGVAQTLYLEVGGDGAEEGALLCLLPKGTPREADVRLSEEDLKVRLNQSVQFQLAMATKGGAEEVGERVLFDPKRHRRLPPLQTMLASGEPGSAEQLVPVTLECRLNAVGLLQVACLAGTERWPLEFQLQDARPAAKGRARDRGKDEARSEVLTPGVSEELMGKAQERMTRQFRKPWTKKDPLTPARMVQSLEEILAQGKGEWNAALLRGLWPTLQARFADREHSFEHEESWISLAGLFLRPGFGVQLDEARMNQLWAFHDDGFWYPGKAMQVHADVLWRRVAGGLSSARQAVLAEETEERVRQATKKPSLEAVRLLGALERLPVERKKELYDLLLERAQDRLREGGHVEPFLDALGRLLNRAPMYGGPETVLGPEEVERAWDVFSEEDWGKSEFVAGITLFLRAARQVDDRVLDVPKALRGSIAGKLRSAGVKPGRLRSLESYVPLQEADRVSLFGEALPAGLVWEG